MESYERNDLINFDDLLFTAEREEVAASASENSKPTDDSPLLNSEETTIESNVSISEATETSMITEEEKAVETCSDG